MNVIIIEDENRAAERLKSMILEIDSGIEVLAILDSIDSTVNWLKNNPQPDLIFLDIHLSDGLSFNIFQQVQIDTAIIFTTAYDEYALKAFEINSIDYLLKPIDATKLKASIDKFNRLKSAYSSKSTNIDIDKLLGSISGSQKSYKSRFLINKGDSLEIVKIDDIAYFYSEDKVTFIRTKDKKRYMIDESLDTLAEKLNPKRFYRINRQMIVFIDSISKISNFFNYKLILELNPEAVNLNTVISRAKVKEFKEWVKG